MNYDVVIVGSGIAGSTLAMVLRKVGASVLVVERDSHPRFVIGESAVPASTMSWVYLAEKYDLPDLLSFCHYPTLKQNGMTGYPKSHFFFMWHREGEPMQPGHQAMFETYPMGIGPDVHMLRSHVDAHLVSRLPDHGVEYRDHTAVTGFEHDGEWGTLQMQGPDGPSEARARLVFDATGHGAVFGRMLGLRDETPRLHTNTRAMFGHFEGVNLLEDVLPPDDDGVFRYNRDAGTLHHCFEGGWIWVIPFDDGVVSVGILLDRDAHPLDRSVPVEDEWKSVIERFPSIAAHLGDAKPTRPIIRTDRIQFSSKGITAPGVVLTPHAAAFVDPLFSTGLTQTAAFISRAAPIVARCLADGDFDHRRFAPVERAFQKEINVTDKLVSGTIASSDDFEVFRQYWRTWVVATNLQIFGRVTGDMGDPEGAALNFGAASAAWTKEVDRRHAIALDTSRPPLERAYALEMFLANKGSWADQLRWMKAQWAAAGPSVRTMRRLFKSAFFRLVRPALPMSMHADNAFVRSFNAQVHAEGPCSVEVPDPGLTDFSERRFNWTFRLVAAELGGRDKVQPEGWQTLAERARAVQQDYARAVAADAPSARGAAVEAIERRTRGRVTEYADPSPLLLPAAARRSHETE